MSVCRFVFRFVCLSVCLSISLFRLTSAHREPPEVQEGKHDADRTFVAGRAARANDHRVGIEKRTCSAKDKSGQTEIDHQRRRRGTLLVTLSDNQVQRHQTAQCAHNADRDVEAPMMKNCGVLPFS